MLYRIKALEKSSVFIISKDDTEIQCANIFKFYNAFSVYLDSIIKN